MPPLRSKSDLSLLAIASSRLVSWHSTPDLGGGVDMARVCVITPGRRLGRLLQRRLADLAAVQSRWFSPPRFVTPVQIVDAVLGMGALPPADTTQRALAWKRALGEIGAGDAERIVGTRGRDANETANLDDGRWLDDTVSKLTRAMVLAAEVPTRCAAVSARGEHERWEALDRLRERYEAILHHAGVCDQRLDQLRRLRRAASGEIVPLADDAPEAIVLVGVLELDRAAREALDVFQRSTTSAGEATPSRVAEPSGRGLFPGSSESESGRDRVVVISAGDGVGLDELGTISPDRPLADLDPERVRIDLPDDSLLWAADPASAARLAIDTIAGWHADGEVQSATDISICSSEASFTRELEIDAAAVDGLHLHDAAGVELSATGAGKLVHALAGYLRRRDRLTLATLCKHGAAQRAVRDRCERLEAAWLTKLDEAAAASPRSRVAGDEGICGEVGVALSELLELEERDAADLIDRQAIRLGTMLGVLLTGTDDDDTIKALAGAISELGACGGLVGSMTLADAADLLLEVMSGTVRAADGRAGAIDVLGWLDAAYDPAPNLILFGFNAGVMPGTPSPNAWLNEGVARSLGMFTSRHAAARDAYLLRHMLDARRDSGCVRTIVAASDADGATLWPSPFVFACDEATALRRAEYAARGEYTKAPVAARRVVVAAIPDINAFPVAPRASEKAPEIVSVTAFREYIQSPYLFFLKHVEKVVQATEPGREEGPQNLGSLVHEILRDFARGDAALSADPREILEWLKENAAERLERWPRHLVESTASMQRVVLERRLERFAAIQASHREEGWSIEHTEWEPKKEVVLSTPKGRLRLKGRVDRIDRRGGELMVIDYKVSDALKALSDVSKAPTNDQERVWRDLQLPLYRHMILADGTRADAWHLAYWSLCSNRNGPRIVTLPLAEAELEAAVELAHTLAGEMLSGVFEDVGDPSDFGGSFSRLCGLRLLDADDEEGEA